MRYKGYYWDEAVKMYYLMSRFYDPSIYRFISADDIQFIDPSRISGLNLFAYCNNNPVNMIDSDGYRPERVKNIFSAITIAGVVALGVGLLFVPGAQIFGVAILVGGITGGAMGGINANASGGDILSGIALGAIGGAAHAVLAVSKVGYLATAAIGFGIGFAHDFASQMAVSRRSFGDVNFRQSLQAGAFSAVFAVASKGFADWFNAFGIEHGGTPLTFREMQAVSVAFTPRFAFSQFATEHMFPTKSCYC